MKDERRFYPDYLFEIVLVVLLTLQVLVSVALLFPASIGRQIDFTAPYQPRPEWYFLWLYQLVRYFHGPFIFVGTIVLPATLFLMLVLLPWIDRGRQGHLRAYIVSAIVFAVFLILTLLPVLQV